MSQKLTKYEKFLKRKRNQKEKRNLLMAKKKHLHSEPLSHVLYQICGLLSEIYFFVDIDTMTSAWWILQLFYCEIPFLISAIAATTTSHLTNKKQNQTKNDVSIRFRFQQIGRKMKNNQRKNCRSICFDGCWGFVCVCVVFPMILRYFFFFSILLLAASDNKFGSLSLSEYQKNEK